MIHRLTTEPGLNVQLTVGVEYDKQIEKIEKECKNVNLDASTKIDKDWDS